MDQSLDKAHRLQFWREDPRVLGVVQNVADGVVVIDAQGYIELFNPAAERLFAYHASEVIGRNIKLLMPPEYSAHHDGYLRRYLETGERHIIGVGRDVTGQRKDGSRFPMYLSVGEVALPGHRGFVGIVHDLSAQKAAQVELAEAGDLLQSILDSMPSVVVGIDNAARVTHWNRAASLAVGLGPAGAAGQPLARLFPFVAPRIDEIRRAARDGGTLNWARIAVPGDAGIRHVDLMVYPLCHASHGAVVRIDDVTERVRIEEMMVQTEKMMSVGGLAAGMAHEINNPLGVIAQACQNLQRRLGVDLAENARLADELGLDLARMQEYFERRGVFRFIDGMREATGRAGRIVTDMLAYSRRSASSFVPAHLNRLVDAALRLASHDYDLKKSYDFRRIRILREGEDVPDRLMCDEMGIEQVILNLLRNAAQAMAGDPANQAPQICLAVCDDGDWVRLEVADNGPGMSDEVARRLFEPFYTTKPVGVGTGLGLSVAYSIVTEQHKGTISADTAAGRGTRFVICLPRAEDSHASLGPDRR